MTRLTKNNGIQAPSFWVEPSETEHPNLTPKIQTKELGCSTS